MRRGAPSPVTQLSVPKQSSRGSIGADLMFGACALTVAVTLPLGIVPSSWALILLGLLSCAVYLLGTDAVLDLSKAWPPRRLNVTGTGSSLRVPLTDAALSMDTLNKFANSCQVREKGLKILQYVCKLTAYTALLPKETSKAFKDLSKPVSIARRFFKFCRWLRHFEDLSEVKDERSSFMRGLLRLRAAANFGADWAEDVCSLERIGFLPRGTLSREFMLFAEFCQLGLALVEMSVASARCVAEAEKTRGVEAAAAEGDGKAVVKQQRKLTLMRLELVKFVSDLGKAIYDCELPFSHEGIFICCGLFSAVVSTHKNMVKVLT